MKYTENRECDDGYTITELLVVLVILGLIAAAISPQIAGRLGSSKVRAAKLQLETVASSIDAFFIDVGRYPTEEEGVEALLQQPNDAVGWLGPYVRSRQNIIDPWGEKILYSFDPSGLPTVATMGEDKSDGGEGAAADIILPDPN